MYSFWILLKAFYKLLSYGKVILAYNILKVCKKVMGALMKIHWNGGQLLATPWTTAVLRKEAFEEINGEINEELNMSHMVELNVNWLHY